MAKIQKVNFVDEVEVFDEDQEVFEMLAGFKDEDGVLHKTFTVRELDGGDEESVQGSNNRGNGAKIVSLILERCVTSIGTITPKSVGFSKWRDIIKKLYVGDQDYMFLKVREVSLGDEFELKHKCPHCQTDLTTYITSDELEIIPFNGDFANHFELPKGFKDKDGVLHNSGTMSHPTGFDREVLGPTAQKNQAKGNTLMLTRLCKFDDESIYVTEDLIRGLVVRDRKYLQTMLSDNLFGVDTKVQITCTSCGETFTGTFNPTNFI